MTHDNKDWKNASEYLVFSSWFQGDTTATRIREFKTWDEVARCVRKSKKTVSIKILANFGQTREYVPEEVWQN